MKKTVHPLWRTRETRAERETGPRNQSRAQAFSRDESKTPAPRGTTTDPPRTGAERGLIREAWLDRGHL